VCADFPFGEERSVPLAAFAQEPTDARSACIAVIQAAAQPGNLRSEVSSYRQLGAPIVVALRPSSVEFWKQREEEPERITTVPPDKVEAYFRAKADELSPEAVFRAKTWGRLDRHFQLTFVDAGLMPVVEREIGQRLTDLIGRVYQGLQRSIWPGKPEVSLKDGQWLLKAAFWLLAAKILHDKRVEGFITLDLLDVDEVFARVGRHYDSARAGLPGVEIRSSRQRDALGTAAQEIARFSHLGHVTTESLSQVYESALITPQVRKELGTHSTPQYLVDYVVWKLRPWIEEIPEEDRHVFEPGCGHAAFLVASIRLLRELLAGDGQIDRKRYLRRHIHGVDVDPFAIEIARLSLALADIPNPNGWDLVCDDMFTKSLLARKARKATILLGNPPFESFPERAKQRYAEKGESVAHANKAAEVLARVLPKLPLGGVIGFVVPQGILHSRSATDIRALLCRDFEIQEICLFPDRVFSFSDAESTVILGRRVSSRAQDHALSYRRVREGDMDNFRLDYKVTAKRTVLQASICEAREHDMRLPDLYELWETLTGQMKLRELASLGKGFDYKGRDLPKGSITIGASGPHAKDGFANFDVEYIHQLPHPVSLNLSKSVIASPRTGTSTGIPQVLLNYAPVGRGPWRLKALIDRKGHPVTSRFITARPISDKVPLEYLWALLNSPLANAYAFSHLAKRDVLVGTMREMPAPFASDEDMRRVAAFAERYIEDVKGLEAPLAKAFDDHVARASLLNLDAEVLRLYDLQPRLERQLLDLFAGQQRAGVPFPFDRYFPEDFQPCLHLHEYLSEGFKNSQASALHKSHRTFDAPEVGEALRRATEDFGE